MKRSPSILFAILTARWSVDNSLLFAAAGGVIAAAAVVGLFIFRLRKRPLAS